MSKAAIINAVSADSKLTRTNSLHRVSICGIMLAFGVAFACFKSLFTPTSCSTFDPTFLGCKLRRREVSM